jgi:hypothetical protein
VLATEFDETRGSPAPARPSDAIASSTRMTSTSVWSLRHDPSVTVVNQQQRQAGQIPRKRTRNPDTFCATGVAHSWPPLGSQAARRWEERRQLQTPCKRTRRHTLSCTWGRRQETPDKSGVSLTAWYRPARSVTAVSQPALRDLEDRGSETDVIADADWRDADDALR